MPGASNLVDFSQIPITPPDRNVIGAFGTAKGWSVYAVLEERFQGTWIPVDSVLVTYGSWPVIGDIPGPNGGVIRSDPSQPEPESLRSVRIEGPVILYERQTANYRAFARFKSGAACV